MWNKNMSKKKTVGSFSKSHVFKYTEAVEGVTCLSFELSFALALLTTMLATMSNWKWYWVAGLLYEKFIEIIDCRLSYPN